MAAGRRFWSGVATKSPSACTNASETRENHSRRTAEPAEFSPLKCTSSVPCPRSSDPRPTPRAHWSRSSRSTAPSSSRRVHSTKRIGSSSAIRCPWCSRYSLRASQTRLCASDICSRSASSCRGAKPAISSSTHARTTSRDKAAFGHATTALAPASCASSSRSLSGPSSAMGSARGDVGGEAGAADAAGGATMSSSATRPSHKPVSARPARRAAVGVV
mmetsp:Transcript_37174/g.119188  ORF Transcript_37174/g.119188 Transcript_37174/m.119188 type:complete len:218 (-) Transcript_37174:211-864(-)